jgi:anthranilate phosphoribosyltransferase
MPPNAFAQYVATLGRGPGRSRALTREEARLAFASVLAGEVDPHQLGAFLMLLRYRGEDADEITGLLEAAQSTLQPMPHAALDWPSYGAGRTRNTPWFLLAALALGQSGIPVLMHGTNEFGTGMTVAEGLRSLGLAPARNADEAAAMLERIGFAYLPIEVLSPPIARLLALRALFGLRSPVNTVARLLDPARAPAGVDGVFHPPYIEVHLGVAERLGRPRLLVLKGGGGEAERVPAKPGIAHLWVAGTGRSEIALPADAAASDASGDAACLVKVWRGEAAPPRALATIRATIELALLALGQAVEADRIWRARREIEKKSSPSPCGRG